MPPGSMSFPATFSHQIFPGEILYLKDLPHGFGSRRSEVVDAGEVLQRDASSLSLLPSAPPNRSGVGRQWQHEPHIFPTPQRLKGWEIHVVLCATDWGVAGKDK